METSDRIDRIRAVKISRTLGIFASGMTAAFWVLGVGVPLAALLARVSGHAAQFVDPDIIAVAGFTVWQALWSTAFSVLIGLPLGLVAARASARGAGRDARWIDALLLLPQGVPTVVAATAWVAWLGRTGYLARLDLAYSLSAVILAHVFFNAPWVALLVAQARRAIPELQVEAAATLGAGVGARLRWVIWPALRWACGAAAVQVLAVCSMSFALVLILGGGPPVETLETALYARLRGGGLDLSGAAVCAAWEILLTLTPWVGLLYLRSRDVGFSSSGSASITAPRSERSARFAAATTLAVGLFFFAPYLVIFFDGGLAAWVHREFWIEAAGPLRLSLGIAFLASVGSLAAASVATLMMQFAPPRARVGLGAGLALPSGLSVLVLGLGGWLAYGRWIDPFEGSFGAIVVLQIVVFFPVVFRMLWPVAQSGQPSVMDAAWTLGASPWQAFWWVDWPRFRGPVFSALALVAGLAFGEVAAVSLFYSEKLIPLPLLVSRWMGQYRFEEARAVSALLLAGSMVLMTGVSVLGQKRGGRGVHVARV